MPYVRYVLDLHLRALRHLPLAHIFEVKINYFKKKSFDISSEGNKIMNISVSRRGLIFDGKLHCSTMNANVRIQQTNKHRQMER